MTCSYPYIYARASIEDCIPQLRDYSEDSIPVLDNDNKLIGVITASDLVEVVGDELNEDYAKFAGLSAEEDLEEPIFLSVKKRLPWLFILLGMGLGVSATVGLFESIVAQLPVIMCFQSLILDMAGNVGTQSLAVAIRVLMDKQLSGKQKLALIIKESRVGLTNGLILGALSFLIIGGYLVLKGNTVPFAFAVSGCLGTAMVLAMLISSLSGTIIPIFLPRRISVPQMRMQLLFFICRSHILKLLYRNSAAQQLFFLLCRCFICSSNYKSLIVSVIAMSLIRFVGS